VGVWGWWRIRLVRWRIFFVWVVVFDLFYTVFLNTISLEITPCNLSVCVVLAIGIGVGVADLVKRCERYVSVGVMRGVKVGCGVVPGMFLVLNFGVSDQSRNYTAYEHALNIFRTTGPRPVVFINGDNHLFPVIYARLVERMREDATLYDRLNLIFKMPHAGKGVPRRTMTWEEERNALEKGIILESRGRLVYYAVFGPYAVDMPESYRLIQKGILTRVVKESENVDVGDLTRVWAAYAMESVYESFEKDFMNREIDAYYFFERGKALILSGQTSVGLAHMKRAREVGYNDNVIHSEMAVFLTDHGFFEEAQLSLERALLYHEDLSGVHNNWGYYYHKVGKYEEAVMSFRKAVDLKPERYGFLNNLAFALFEAGHKEEASGVFQKSLSLKEYQPEIRKFMKEKGMLGDTAS
jgi:Flp pilus assembly protein TadD